MDQPQEVGGLVASSGWTELTEGQSRSTFVWAADGEWRALVVVLGEPDTGVWRHIEALVCQP